MSGCRLAPRVARRGRCRSGSRHRGQPGGAGVGQLLRLGPGLVCTGDGVARGLSRVGLAGRAPWSLQEGREIDLLPFLCCLPGETQCFRIQVEMAVARSARLLFWLSERSRVLSRLVETVNKSLSSPLPRHCVGFAESWGVAVGTV